jgi:hypothetical protein
LTARTSPNVFFKPLTSMAVSIGLKGCCDIILLPTPVYAYK